MELSSRNTPPILTVPAPVSSMTLESNNPNVPTIVAGDGSPAGYTTSPTMSIYGATPTYHIPGNDPKKPRITPTPISVPFGTVAASGSPMLGKDTAQVTAPHWATAAPPWDGDNSAVPSYPAATNPNPEPSPSILPFAAIALVLAAAWCL